MLNHDTDAPAAVGAEAGRTFDGATGQLVESDGYASGAVSQIDATALPPKAERFARLFVSEGNAAAAYRTAYECAPTTARTTITRKAHELRHSQPVAARIRELQALATAEFTVTLGERLQALHTIATADVSECIQLVTESCRHCRGIDGRPQWHSEAELKAALAQHTASLQSSKPLPLPLFGGLDFDPSLPPVAGCISCHGHGVPRVVITPSDEWSAAARAAFKGARQRADGSIEVEFENRLTAADQLARLAGLYIERSESRNLNLSVTADLAMANDVDGLLQAYKRGAQR